MVIEIPIEIRIQDSKEIEKKINDIKEADKKFKTLPSKGKSKSSVSQAVPTLVTESRGGLEEAGIQTTPTRGRNDPLGIRKKQEIITKKKLDKILKDKFGQAEQIIDFVSGKGNILGQSLGFVSKLAPPLAVALIAIGFIEKIIDVIFGPGGPFERRANEFQERAKKLFSERDQALKRQGIKTVRITSYYGSRGGRDTTFTTLDPLRRGQYVFDRNLNLLNKGVLD